VALLKLLKNKQILSYIITNKHIQYIQQIIKIISMFFYQNSFSYTTEFLNYYYYYYAFLNNSFPIYTNILDVTNLFQKFVKIKSL